jgi:lipopolysaccharide transport system ATP-binding protein
MSDSDVVIRVEGLGKKYALHHEKSERYTALRDMVACQAKAAGRLLNPFTLAGQLRKVQREAAAERAESEEEFWALKDVSFEIRRGERVEIRGRVASLLEVGTGFHPELP